MIFRPSWPVKPHNATISYNELNESMKNADKNPLHSDKFQRH